MRKPPLYVSIVIAAAAGFTAGDLFNRAMLVVEAKRVADFARQSAELAQSAQDTSRHLRALEALATAKLLRDGDTADAIRFVDDAIESSRMQLARADSAESQVMGRQSAELLAQIAEYQKQYPWSPPEPDPAVQEFAERVGVWGVSVRDGQVSLRVSSAPPGSFFSQLGLRNGERIVRFNDRPIGDVLPEWAAALDEGQTVELVVESASGATREVRGAAPPRPQ